MNERKGSTSSLLVLVLMGILLSAGTANCLDTVYLGMPDPDQICYELDLGTAWCPVYLWMGYDLLNPYGKLIILPTYSLRETIAFRKPMQLTPYNPPAEFSFVPVGIGSAGRIFFQNISGVKIADGGSARLYPAIDNPYKNYQYWYKGQTHAHANICDSGLPVEYCECGQNPDVTPYELMKAYYSTGSRFMSITHHDTIVPNPDVDGILYIAGEENGDCWAWHGLPTWYNPPHIIGIGIQKALGEDAAFWWYCQSRIDYFLNQGGIAILAHPWNPNDWDSWACGASTNYVYGGYLAGLQGYTGFEVDNDHPQTLIDWGYVLASGRRVWAFAADDSHHLQDIGHGFIVVNSNLKESEVDSEAGRVDTMNNIKAGNFYSVHRNDQTVPYPEILKIETSTSTVAITAKGANKVSFIDFEASKTSSSLKTIEYDSDVLDEFTVTYNFFEGVTPRYFLRMELSNSWGAKAYSQPVFF
jgi:hypothetical protein